MVSDNVYNSQYMSAAKLLLDTSSGTPSEIPSNYLRNLDHTFVDGHVSLVSAISTFSNFQGLNSEEIEEVIEDLRKVNPYHYPDLEDIQETNVSEYFQESAYETNLSFVEDNLGTAEKTERVLASCIESVFGREVKNIRDLKGKFPSEENNFLRKDDGTFSGSFTSEGYKFRFEIAPTTGGWLCTYRLSENSLDSLPERVLKIREGKKKPEASARVRSRGWIS